MNPGKGRSDIAFLCILPEFGRLFICPFTEGTGTLRRQGHGVATPEMEPALSTAHHGTWLLLWLSGCNLGSYHQAGGYSPVKPLSHFPDMENFLAKYL